MLSVSSNGKVAEEVWTGSPVDYSGLRVFGCPAYVHIPNEERSKLDAKSRQCIFLGYQKRVKDFKLWDPKANKVVISRDVLIHVELETHDIEDHAWNAGKSTIDRPRRAIKPLISQEKSRWVGAIVEEIQSLHKNKTWDLVELLEEKKAIRCKWV
ncbi:hypothetical protein AAG906_019607 [Vitis piasezkii]